MQVIVRIVGALAGVIAAFPTGMATGCGVYEASNPSYAQCGYEFEGVTHVLVAIAVLILVLGFLGQWLAGWLWRRFRREA